jgi:hypothetical protein
LPDEPPAEPPDDSEAFGFGEDVLSAAEAVSEDFSLAAASE